MLSKISDSGHVSKNELMELQEFAHKAASYWTLRKITKLGLNYKSYKPMVLNQDLLVLQGFLIGVI